jgi:hypothetical protein
MTDIEELVRGSLRTAPGVTPSVSDPIAAVTSRVRRILRVWGGGALAMAAVAAAVVVPLSLASRTGGQGGGVLPGSRGPTPSSSSSGSSSPGLTVWQQHDAAAVTAGGGWLWELERSPKAQDGSGHLAKVDPRTHAQVQKWNVAAPYDFVAYGLDHVWAWGGGDGGYPDGRLQVIDVASGATRTWTSPGRGFGGVAFLDGHAWVTAGSTIWEFDAGGRHKLSVTALGSGVTEPAAIFAAAGKLEVQTSSTSIQYVVPNPGGVGARLGDAQAVADATERLLGVQGSDIVLVSTGADVERQRVKTGEMEGNAVVNATVVAAVTLSNGDVLIATGGETSAPSALWLATAKPDGTLCPDCVRKLADGLDIISLAANPGGGADFVLADGTAEHWQP